MSKIAVNHALLVSGTLSAAERRQSIRKVLNGIGLPFESHIRPLSMSDLETVYSALCQGNGGDIIPAALPQVEKIDALAMQQKFTLETSHIPTTTTQTTENPTMTPFPQSQPATINESDLAALRALKSLLAVQVTPQAAPLDENKIIELIKKHSMATEVKVLTPDSAKTVPTGLHHKALPDVIKALAAGLNVLLVGPAGSGKTTLAEQAAHALGIPFYFNGAISSEYKLTGFMDAQGRLVSTAFRRAYEHGGLYLFDEMDASLPDALLAFNAALANGQMDFPDGTIKRHPDFKVMAACNTFGRGADRVYVGRNQLDAASLNRFVFVELDYDLQLEKALAANDEFVEEVVKIRQAVTEHKIRHVISPRNSIFGARLLAAGFKKSDVMDMAIWQGLDADSVKKIKASV